MTMQRALQHALLCFSLSLFCVSANAQLAPIVSESYSCRVNKVWDGDTFDATCKDVGEIRVRLHQADAPERSQPRGVDSLRWLNTRVWKQRVTVTLIEIEGATANRQQRWVGSVVHNRVNVNRLLVRQGHAWAAPGFTKPGDDIRKAEAAARKARRGLWQDAKPISPWDWRHGRRTPK